MRTESEMRALLVLLGDEDDRVAGVARETLLEEGEAALPFLQEAAVDADARVRGRARLLLEDMRLRNLEERWEDFAAQPDDDMDLEEGCLLLSGLIGPVDEGAAGRFLDAIAGMVRAHQVAVGGLTALTEVLADNLGFRGGPMEQPENHYLSRVLERRIGIPISLATVYVLVGRRAGLPVSGVAMPGHYLARYETPNGPVFIDGYSRGRTYDYATLARLLRSKGPGFQAKFLAPCTHRFTLFRMLNNLDRLYTESGQEWMAQTIRRFRARLGGGE